MYVQTLWKKTKVEKAGGGGGGHGVSCSDRLRLYRSPPRPRRRRNLSGERQQRVQRLHDDDARGLFLALRRRRQHRRKVGDAAPPVAPRVAAQRRHRVLPPEAHRLRHACRSAAAEQPLRRRPRWHGRRRVPRWTPAAPRPPQLCRQTLLPHPRLGPPRREADAAPVPPRGDLPRERQQVADSTRVRKGAAQGQPHVVEHVAQAFAQQRARPRQVHHRLQGGHAQGGGCALEREAHEAPHKRLVEQPAGEGGGAAEAAGARARQQHAEPAADLCHNLRVSAGQSRLLARELVPRQLCCDGLRDLADGRVDAVLAARHAPRPRDVRSVPVAQQADAHDPVQRAPRVHPTHEVHHLVVRHHRRQAAQAPLASVQEKAFKRLQAVHRLEAPQAAAPRTRRCGRGPFVREQPRRCRPAAADAGGAAAVCCVLAQRVADKPRQHRRVLRLVGQQRPAHRMLRRRRVERGQVRAERRRRRRSRRHVPGVDALQRRRRHQRRHGDEQLHQTSLDEGRRHCRRAVAHNGGQRSDHLCDPLPGTPVAPAAPSQQAHDKQEEVGIRERRQRHDEGQSLTLCVFGRRQERDHRPRDVFAPLRKLAHRDVDEL
eukprot:Rhum_TRINITY_DN14828_c7_g1::Rhum_TRINITY_DN14828_c7_g1_i6::g.123882::m.123882